MIRNPVSFQSFFFSTLACKDQYLLPIPFQPTQYRAQAPVIITDKRIIKDHREFFFMENLRCSHTKSKINLFQRSLTNLIYQSPELLSRPYYINCDMSKYIALVIDTLNHDGSISSILDPSERIQNIVQKYKNGEDF